jgi:hypothetical protein
MMNKDDKKKKKKKKIWTGTALWFGGFHTLG